jgi:hypothetical protein
MSFKLLDRIRSLQNHTGLELSNAPDLTSGTDEFKLKQHLLALANEEMVKLQETLTTLTEEWEVDLKDPPSPFEELEDYRDWEGTILYATLLVGELIERFRSNYQHSRTGATGTACARKRVPRGHSRRW